MEDLNLIPPDDVDEVVPCKHLLFYTLDKKKAIADEAYNINNGIRAIA
jgi:hypothetical protein